ncbi:MAG: hypothetical protein L0Y44_14065 [Phycisphaerales bacterium]|nr:hypothetical protein [Phycisphaerales bacterium]MCI0631769.1 hypothetical protein [Phycisphaerales bacterium]MCI0677390.1 hypothetical protein [Phycisphaerales bacterium]
MSKKFLIPLIAIVLCGVAVVPAHASSWKSSFSVNLGAGCSDVSFGRIPCAPSRPVCAPTRSFWQIEYDRGFKYGRTAGFDAGYSDALTGRCFNNQADLCGYTRYSRFFKDGFSDGFGRAYDEGFQRGKSELACHRPRWRW